MTGSDVGPPSEADPRIDPRIDSRTDDEVLAAHVGGDRHAFGELVRRHRDRLWAVAVRTTGDREEAADALQDALLSAYRAAGTFRGESAVTTWLHRIVVNACLDRLRRRATRRAREVWDDAAVGRVADPRDAPVVVDARLDVTAALRRLPVDQRTAVVLVDLQQLGVAEAAQILGIPPGTVKSRCSRGRAAMAAMLRPGAADGNPPGAPGVASPDGDTPGRRSLDDEGTLDEGGTA